MEKSQKGTSTSADPKDKKSFLDDDIGKDFLGSWKSMSMAQDELDFNFDKDSMSNKKAFNLNKMDMDFNLDGDFGKLSKFKVDMPDLDFSSLSKKGAKKKEQSEGESSSGKTKNKEKQDAFDFSFDFDMLDSFKIGSPAKKGEGSPVRDLESKESDSNSNKCQVSKMNLVDDAISDEGQAKEPASAKSLTTSMAEVVASDVETKKSSNNDLPSTVGAKGDLGMSHVASLTVSPKKTLVKGQQVAEQRVQSLSVEKPVPNEPLPQKLAQGLSVRSLGSSDCMTDAQDEANCIEQEETIEAGTDEDINYTVVTGTVGEFNQACSKLNDSASPQIAGTDFKQIEKEKTDYEIPIKKMIDNRPKAHELDVETPFNVGNSFARPQDCKEKVQDSILSEPVGAMAMLVKEKEPSVVCSKFFDSPKETGGQEPHLLASAKGTTQVSKSKTIPFTKSSECRVNGDVEDLSKKLVNPVLSEPGDDEVMPVKEREPVVIRSKFFSRSAETEGCSCHLSASERVTYLGSGQTAMNLSQIDGKSVGFKANDIQTERKPGADSKSFSDNLMDVPTSLLGNEEKEENSIGDVSAGKATQNRGKTIINTGVLVKERNTVVLESERSVKDLDNFSKINPGNSSGKATDNLTIAKSTNVFPSMDLRLKMNSIKLKETETRKPDGLSLKISRAMEGSKDQSNATLKSFATSLKKPKGNVEVQGIKSPKTMPLISRTERKAPMLSSLKRKTLEPSNVDKASINPTKRLSQSPSANSRNFKDLSMSRVNEQVSDRDQMGSTTKKVFINHQTTTSGALVPWEGNSDEQRIALVVENDGTVEKAEAYAKELDNICYMLKKKQEEAKELLVRALVNNNNLLMLNHPIFDEKIRLAQKFAEKLGLD